MSVPHRVRGVKVLKAVSSPIRLQILNLLFDRGPLSYTELMSSLKMNPSRDSGRFAYHLKFLLKADLIEADVEARKYCLTELGKMVLDVADRVEKRALKPKGMLVRASRLAVEEFDANKIASSLIREARMPADLAQKAAKEAEKRLLKARTKYLTAPLVREVVNAILIEKGLEEYRHKLTRLGLPVHEVTLLVEPKGKMSKRMGSVHETAGEAVLKEYMLLKVFPRDIADAYLSGSLHIRNLGSWILKPSEIVHDLRFFCQNGLSFERIDSLQPSCVPPQNFESALSTTFNVVLHSAKEVAETQTFEYFNVFLAPFAKAAETSKTKEALRSFILDISQHADVSLNLELTVPDFMGNKPAIGASGKVAGVYGDFGEETQTLASLILDVLIEEGRTRPLLNPKVLVKLRPETFTDERAKALLLKAHRLASERSMVYLACLLEEDQKQSIFFTSGCRLGTDLTKDWEIDTLRTGCLGMVSVNLPRIAYETEMDKSKFLELLKERLEMATRALEIKYGALKQHGERLLPFLMQNVNGDRYLRLEGSSRLVNLIGLKETLETFCGKSSYHDEKALKLMEEISQVITDFLRKSSKRQGKRLLPAMLPDIEASERLARLDVDRYGFGKVKFSGTREKPYYSTISMLPIQGCQIPQEFLAIEQKQRDLRSGGSFAAIELGEAECKPDELMSLTKQIAGASGIEFFVYNRKLTYCANCKNSWFGLLPKCPSCGGVGTLRIYDRFALS